MDYEEHRLVTIDLEDDDVIHVDYLKYRLVKNDFGEDVVVYVDYGDHRLVTIELEDDVVLHVDYVKYSVWSRMTWETSVEAEIGVPVSGGMIII